MPPKNSPTIDIPIVAGDSRPCPYRQRGKCSRNCIGFECLHEEDMEAARQRIAARPAASLLGQKHTGSRISAHGILGRIKDRRYHSGLDWACGEMLRSLEEMAQRFYSG